jgi:hypothetical protein
VKAIQPLEGQVHQLPSMFGATKTDFWSVIKKISPFLARHAHESLVGFPRESSIPRCKYRNFSVVIKSKLHATVDTV